MATEWKDPMDYISELEKETDYLLSEVESLKEQLKQSRDAHERTLRGRVDSTSVGGDFTIKGGTGGR